ncbi:MAG: SDR family NAD(P)-dependent oxidoreductase [Desulfobacteraceae bacterium]|jgi:3-oxoacyl-[acyl-carrier protein] reductase
MNVHGSNILITGGAGAFGRVFTLDLASRGAQVLACDRNGEGLAGLKEEAHQEKLTVETFQADVSQEEDVEKLFGAFVDRFGRLDVVINNAGVAEDGLLIKKEGEQYEKFPLSRWQRGVAINLTGVFLCGREAAFHMITQGGGGVIINISSISRHGNFVQSNYSATKAAIVALTVVWSKELSRYGIRSVALAPGYVDTPMTRNIPEEIRSRIISLQIPRGRLGEIREVTHAVRFAIENDYLNGRVIDLDGGLRI